MKGPDGSGVGPVLEMRDCLRVLERDEKRPQGMEDVVLGMAAEIFEHNDKAKKGEGRKVAQELLDSGKALEKFWEIAKAQGAKKVVASKDLIPGKLTHEVKAPKDFEVKYICTREVVEIARALGTPKIREAGIYIEKMPGQSVKKGETLMTLYATTQDRMEDGVKAVNVKKLYEI